jgi:YbgC/YbaW family acyl-CoA thioester hydrolase
MPQPFSEEDLKSNDPPRFAETRRVRFQDVDAAGIVFYPRVLEYFSDAYMAWLHEAAIDIPRTLELGEIAFPLVHAEADYLRPLRFGDTISVEIAATKVGETSFTIGYRIRTATGRVASIGQTAHVCIDRATFRACPIPEELMSLLAG